MAAYTKWLLFLKKILTGFRAFTTQSYTEANVKNGSQFETNYKVTALAASATHRFIFKTGSKPVSIKARVINFTGLELIARPIKNVTFTGTLTTQNIYNLSDVNPQPTTVQILSGAGGTPDGTQFGADNDFYGTEGVGNRSAGTFGVIGLERSLAANTTYELRTINPSLTGVINFSTYLSWYEGDSDLPANEGEI